MTRPIWLILLAAALVAIAVALFVNALRFALRTIALLRNGIRTTGTVIGHDETIDDETPIYASIVEFTSTDGKRRRFTSRLQSSHKWHAEGQSVPVLYERGREKDAIIAGWIQLWGVATVLAFSGLSAVVFALACLFLPAGVS